MASVTRCFTFRVSFESDRSSGQKRWEGDLGSRMRDLRYKYRASASFVSPTARIIPWVPGKYRGYFRPFCRWCREQMDDEKWLHRLRDRFPTGHLRYPLRRVFRFWMGGPWLQPWGREYGWNSRPDRLAVVERAVPGGTAERAHSHKCPAHLSIPTAQGRWHTVSAAPLRSVGGVQAGRSLLG
jgi:hypothetical protein